MWRWVEEEHGFGEDDDDLMVVEAIREWLDLESNLSMFVRYGDEVSD